MKKMRFYLFLCCFVTVVAMFVQWNRHTNQVGKEIDGHNDCREFPHINDLYYLGMRLLGHRYYICENGEFLHIRT